MEKKSFTRVTLALDIISKISDGPFKGYHELSIVKHQIDLFDSISVSTAPHISLSCNVKGVPCTPENLCWKATVLLKEKYHIDKNVHITIDKNIPVMGGLAGGSANAATMISLLNEFWELGLSAATMIVLGKELGMDVPFYFIGQTAFDSEATSVLYSVSTTNRYTFILAVPDFGVSTRAAYSGIDYEKIGKNRSQTDEMIRLLQNNNNEGVISLMHNDFEYNVFNEHPRLAEIKKELIRAGCCQSFLTGSGSTIVGIVPQEGNAEDIAHKISCRTIIAHSL